MSKQTKYEALQAKWAANTELLSRLTGLRGAQMYDYILDMGWSYLRAQCRYDQAGIDHLSQLSFYWRWWVDQWHMRDEEFIAQHALHECVGVAHARKADNMLRAYQYMHEKAINHENLCKAYCHIMTHTMPFIEAKKKQRA